MRKGKFPSNPVIQPGQKIGSRVAPGLALPRVSRSVKRGPLRPRARRGLDGAPSVLMGMGMGSQDLANTPRPRPDQGARCGNGLRRVLGLCGAGIGEKKPPAWVVLKRCDEDSGVAGRS